MDFSERRKEINSVKTNTYLKKKIRKWTKNFSPTAHQQHTLLSVHHIICLHLHSTDLLHISRGPPQVWSFSRWLQNEVVSDWEWEKMKERAQRSQYILLCWRWVLKKWMLILIPQSWAQIRFCLYQLEVLLIWFQSFNNHAFTSFYNAVWVWKSPIKRIF